MDVEGRTGLTEIMGGSALLLAGLLSSLGGLVFGYELAIISGALLQLKLQLSLSCAQQEVLVSALLVGALLASVVGGSLIDRYGRRSAIMLSNMLVLAGSLLLLLTSPVALLLGRVTVGGAISLSSMSCCIFVSEMVNPQRRGLLVTLYEAGITVGILAAYAVNYLLSGRGSGWRWMFGLAVVPTLLQLAVLWFLPSRNNNRSALEDSAQPDVARAGLARSPKAEPAPYTFASLFRSKDNLRWRTVLGLALVVFQQLSGQPNLLLYASTIFRAAGFVSNASALLASVGIGLIKVAATVTSMVFSDRVGRRPLLVGGCVIMSAGLITIAVLSGNSLSNGSRTCEAEEGFGNASARTSNATPESSILQTGDAACPRLILLCMLCTVAAYSIGFGPITWVVLSEIFPPAVRGRAFAFTSCFNWATNLLVSCTFLNVIDWVGLSGTFFFYGMNVAVAALLFYFLLPETKGKTLQEIDQDLRFDSNPLSPLDRKIDGSTKSLPADPFGTI